MLRQLTWRAAYNDDTELPQYNEDGTENEYKDIERHKLARFDLLENGTPIFSYYPREGQRLIYRMRNFIKITPEGEERHRIWIVGWQMTVMTINGPKNITALNYFLEDGTVVFDDSRNNLELLQEEI